MLIPFAEEDQICNDSPENDLFSIEVPAPEIKFAGITSIAFDGLLDPPLRLHEDLREGCGGQLWPAGMVLAKYMLTHHRHDLRGKNIIEIGAGGGLVGLAVAAGCDVDRPLLITDQRPMLALMEMNIALNGLHEKARSVVYDWGSEPPLFEIHAPSNSSVTGAADVVLAADCVYFEPAFPVLLRTLKDLIGPSTTCYFCFKKRRKADMRFIKSVMKMFKTNPIPYQGMEDDQRQSIFLFELHSRDS